jgi:hypothetical protein
MMRAVRTSARAVLAVLVVALLAAQGCTKTVYYAVMAPHEAMDNQSSCFRQCQMLHAGQTKQFLSCVGTCPDSRVVNEKHCNQVPFDARTYGCTTMHAQTFDGVAFGLGIGFLVLLNIAIVALAASANSNTTQQP